MKLLRERLSLRALGAIFRWIIFAGAEYIDIYEFEVGAVSSLIASNGTNSV